MVTVPPPDPTAAPPPPVGGIEEVVCAYPWPCAEALAVKWCESGDRWDRVGAGVNYGGFQINSVHAGRFGEFWTRWADPAYNTMMAFTIWSEQGWRPWGCRP